MIFEPLSDKVVVRHIAAEDALASGVQLPGKSVVLAEVVAVGPGDCDTAMLVSKGDKVVVSKFSGTEMVVDGQSYFVIRQSDILTKIK